MTSAKAVVLTAIANKGVQTVIENASTLADDLFCSEQYVKSVCNQVKNGKIVIRGGSVYV